MNQTSLYVIPVLFVSLFFFGIFNKPDYPLKTLDYVNTERYMGTWYEIARFPHRFQEGCFGTTATYTLKKNGTVTVVNQCRLNDFNGELNLIKGKAWSADETNAKIKVQASIQGDQVRVSGKSKDDLQSVIAMLKANDLGIAMQFTNYR